MERIYDRGVQALDKRDFDVAIAAFTEVIRIDPTRPGAYYDRGVAYGNKGQQDSTIAEFTAAVGLTRGICLR